MKNHLNQILAHTHKGHRDYQEDSYAYRDSFVLVADGVGGLAKGDIASDIVVRTWQNAFEIGAIRLANLHEDVNIIVQEAINELIVYSLDNPESAGMGSTLACAAIIDERLVAVHIGDSRIYHFSRDGQLKWRSKDHSLVQELVTGGIITEDEAATHPRRNVITRVLQAKEGHETKASVQVLDHLETGDIIMVCSDGVVESWSDVGISSVIMGHQNINDIIKVIGDHCAMNSKDNNTALICEIELVGWKQEISESTPKLSQQEDLKIGLDNEDEIAAKAESDSLSNNKIEETEADLLLQQRSFGFKQKYYRGAIFAIIIFLTIILLYQKFSK